MIVEPSADGAQAVLLLAPPCQRDERDISELGLPPNVPGQVVPVHARHADVQKYDDGSEILELLQRRLRIVDDAHLGTELLEQDAEAVGGVAIVVDDQDGTRREREE